MDNVFLEVEKVVRKAGKIVLDKELYKKRTIKSGDCNYVTEVDYAVQDFLSKELTRIISNCNIIAEEASQNQYDFSRPTWILDPVDGTTNLMHQYNHSAVSLALVVDGKPTMGMIYNPYMNEMFFGLTGQGSYLNNEKTEVSKISILKDCLIGFGTTPYDREKIDTTFRIVSNVFKNSQEIRRSGSAALDIAYVAVGRIDGFFELQLQPWDYAAGLIILEEAGGRITNWTEQSPSLITADSIIATNGLIHEVLIQMMKEN
jgi:myo-inositol-1(or 4)-monophosphatase